MAGKKTGKRLLTWVLVLVMALSLLPLNALAAENGVPENTNPSIVKSEEARGAHLVKSATKEGDTYKIQLESWVTGKVEQTTGSAPLDIVLVLDQSGSMEGQNLSKLKEAVRNFVTAINEDATTNNVEHRIAIVGFASNGNDGWDNADKWKNTGLFVNGVFKKYITYTSSGYYAVYALNQANSYYIMQPGLFGNYAVKVSYNSQMDSWGYWEDYLFYEKWVAVTPRESEDDANNSHTQFYEWRESGSQGLTTQDYKDALVSSNADSIDTAISNLSASGATRASYGMEMANNVFKNNALRKGSSRVVVFFTDGEPGQNGYETNEAGRAIAQAYATKKTNDAKVFSVGMFNNPSTHVGKFMDYVSSNYPNANASSNYWGNWTITPGDKDADKYYMTVENDNLSDVFQQISGSILTSDVKADANTVLTDTLSQYFDFDGVTVENGTVTGVTVKKVAYAGNDTWATDGEDITSDVTVHLNGKTVAVRGFDYSDEKNVVTDGTTPSGYKLVVTFNVKPDTSYTNWGASGKYETNNDKATLANGNDTFATVASPKAPVDTYQVTYKPGTGTGNEYTDQYYLNGAKTKVLENRFAAQEGYEFDYWKDENNNPYKVGDEITFDKSNVVLTAQWKLIEAAELSVEKTVTKVGETTVAAGNNTIPTAYPGDEIEWTITVTNSGNAEGNFTLKETLSDITVKDAAGSPVTLSNNEWRGTVPANDSVIYTVTYTVKASDVTDNGLVNTVTMNGDGEESSDPVPTAQKYTVTYEYTGTAPTDAPAVPVAAQHEYGAEVTIANVPTLTGYTFHGWTLPEGLTENGGKFNMPAGDVTITGYWTKNTIPTYTFDLNDSDTITVYKEFKSKYGRSATMSFEATATIKKQETGIIVNPGLDNNVTNHGSAANVEPIYNKEVGKATGTVTLRTGTTDGVFKFSEKYDLEPGNYRITVKETEGNDRYVDYDTKTYTYDFIVNNKGEISIETPITCTFTNVYTKRHTAATPSKPTLNTGDHYAYVMGYPDGTVRPNGSITRAEVSAILFRLLSDKTRDEYFTTESSFTDVKAGAWYNNSIATLEKAGVIVDTAKGGAFRPNEAITRAELAAMLAQFSDAKPVKGVKFSDVSAEHWAYEAIAIAAKMGWIEGYPDGTFRPDATITRAEMMTLVNRALERVPSDEDHLLSKRVMLTFPDCKSGDWFYIAVQEATNSHTYERAATEKNGDEQWTALRANRDWTLLEK